MVPALVNAFKFENFEEVPEEKDHYNALSYQIIELITSKLTWSRPSLSSSPSFEHIKVWLIFFFLDWTFQHAILPNIENYKLTF